jgi:signal transduction histidine kinase
MPTGGVIRTYTDITESERAHQQLNTILELSPNGFVLFDGRQQLVFCNANFEKMTGRTWVVQGQMLDLAGFWAAFQQMLLPDEAPAVAFEDDAPVLLRLARPERRVLQVQQRNNLAGHGETVLYFRDVTHEVEVDRMKSEFLALAAHELRTPMMSVMGYTELLLMREFPPERQKDMLQTIFRQSGLLVKMINELLDLSRIEARAGLDLRIAEHPLKNWVLETVKGQMQTQSGREIRVDDLPDVKVLIDPEKMERALSNVLSNAIKYSPGGQSVQVSARLSQYRQQPAVVLSVQDKGIGMSAQQCEKAFERFYRVDASGSIPGTGLGLSLVKEILDLHQGRVTLESEPGQGTTVHLWIPLAQP